MTEDLRVNQDQPNIGYANNHTHGELPPIAVSRDRLRQQQSHNHLTGDGIITP